MGGGFYLLDGTVTATTQSWKFADPEVGTDDAGYDLPYFALAWIAHL
jgi:hypothetical protein